MKTLHTREELRQFSNALALAEQQTFCNKRWASVERERDNREPGHGTVDVHAYDTHNLLALRLSESIKTGHNVVTRQEGRRGRRESRLCFHLFPDYTHSRSS